VQGYRYCLLLRNLLTIHCLCFVCFYLNLFAFIYIIGFIVLTFLIWVFVHCFIYRFLLRLYSVCIYLSAALAFDWLFFLFSGTLFDYYYYYYYYYYCRYCSNAPCFFQVSVTVVHCSASLTPLSSC
jgi:hypothetical protein